MDAEVKQRNRRRKRAQRMQAQRGDMSKAADSNEEDESPARREKPPRPPNRRKKTKDPLVEEDIIDGFAILAFKTYEDLETCLKIASKENVRRLTEIERPKVEPKPHTITHHFSVNTPHGLTMTQDPATSDDSGRASERLTGSSVAPRDADSSRDRLSDASSRCSSGKGYICDSEGDDDKGSDASSVIFGATPGSRKHEFPGALLPPGLNTATSSSPVPAPTAPDHLQTTTTAPNQTICQQQQQLHLPPPPPVPRHVIIGEDKQRLLLPPPPIIAASAAATSSMTVTAGGGGSMPSPAPAAIAPPPPPSPLLHCKPPQPPPLLSSAVATCSSSASATSSHLPMSMPQTAAAPIVHHPSSGLGPSAPGGSIGGAATNHARTDSPAVATSAPGAVYHPPYQPLYAPYAAANVHTPYTATTIPTTTPLPTTATTVTASAVPTIRSSTPISHSPSMDHHHHRDSYSNSRTNVTPMSCPPPPQPTNNTTVSSSLSSKPWPSGVGPPPQLSPAAVASRPTPPLHAGPSFATMFAPPMPPPTVVSRSSPTVPPPQQQQQQHHQQPQPQPPPPTNPNPFSAESLFQSSNQADMLRRELDSRFLASQDRTMNVVGPPPPPYLRTEMHQHQHHHTHVHQHTTSLLPPTPTSSLFPSPLFKDIPKLGSHESPFYRQNIGIPPTYSGYTPSLLHPGLTGPTPFVPPSHLPAFQPKKSGKWNAMHVRVAWEIYHHQHKGDKGGPSALKGDLLRPPTHLFNPSVRSHELTPTFGPPLGHHRQQQQQQQSLPPPTFDQSAHPGSLFTSPAAHSLGGKPASSFRTSGFHHLPKMESSANAMSPFTRYGGPGGPPGFGAGPASSPFSVSPFPPSAAGRPNELPPMLHDPWRRNFPPNMQPTMPPPHQWAMKPDPLLEQREREERERVRREREERERREREREEKRRLEQQQAAEQRERERREKERREMEQQRERERLLHQQRLVESAKPMQSVMRDRSPMRNGDMGEIRIKEEPRCKEDEVSNLLRSAADPRYHPYLRPGPPHALQRVLPHHYPPPTSHWPPPPPHEAFYRYDPLRYNPLEVAMRADEERLKMFSTYGHPSHPLRTKDPGLMHLRPGPGPPQQQQPPTHKMCATPPTDLHKKEEPR